MFVDTKCAIPESAALEVLPCTKMTKKLPGDKLLQKEREEQERR
jgi:hypothetical protein